MTPALASELLKLRSAPGARTALWAGVVVAVLLTASFCGLSDLRATDERDAATNAALAAIFGAVAGSVLVTTEFRHRTASTTFTVTPDRDRVLAAKAMVALLAGGVAGLTAGFACVALTEAWFAARGVETPIGVIELAGIVGGTALAVSLLAGVGVAVGALVADQTVAVTLILVEAFLAEPAIATLDERAAALGPASAAAVLAGSRTVDSGLAPAAGAGVLMLYVVVLGTASAAALRRREIA